MRTTLQVLVLAGALAGSGAAVMAAAPAAGHKAKAASMSATGTIEKFDAGSKTLTVKTSKGEQNFVLGDAAVLHRGSKTVTADQLASLDGQPVKVRFTEANGVQTATSVMVGSAKAHHSAAASSAHPAAAPKK